MKKLKSFIRWCIGGSFALVISACYGIVSEYDIPDYEKSFNLKDTAGQPIEGLELSLDAKYENPDGSFSYTNKGKTYSDENGNAFFTQQEGFTGAFEHNVTISDVDGAYNGGPYQSITTNVSDPYNNYFDITMEE